MDDNEYLLTQCGLNSKVILYTHTQKYIEIEIPRFEFVLILYLWFSNGFNKILQRIELFWIFCSKFVWI